MTDNWASRQWRFLCIGRWRLQWNDTLQWSVNVIWTAAFLPKMRQHRFRRYAQGGQQPGYPHQTDTDCQHQDRHHLHLKCHLYHLVRMTECKVSKLNVCHADMYIHLLLFPTLNFSILLCVGWTVYMINIIWVVLVLIPSYSAEVRVATKTEAPSWVIFFKGTRLGCNPVWTTNHRILAGLEPDHGSIIWFL